MSSDLYGINKYDEEEFYEDRYDDFDDYYDAEDYCNGHKDD